MQLRDQAARNWPGSRLWQTVFGEYVEAVAKQFADEGQRRVNVKGKWKPYTLDNVVAAMRSRAVRGEEMGTLNTPGRARALASTRFKTVEELRDAAKRLLSDTATVNQKQDMARNMVFDWTQQIDPFFSRQYGVSDEALMALVELARVKRLKADKARQILAANGFVAMPDNIVQLSIDVSRAFMSTPLSYFEAKPQRAVKFEEFVGALVPGGNYLTETTYDALAKRLREKGVQVRRVADQPEADRLETQRRFALELHQASAEPDVLFQDTTDDFYSQLRRSVDALPTKAASASGWMQQLKGLVNKGTAKQVEIDATGVTEWLQLLKDDGASFAPWGKNDPTITKEQLLTYLDDVGIKTKTVRYGDFGFERRAVAASKNTASKVLAESITDVVTEWHQLADWLRKYGGSDYRDERFAALTKAQVWHYNIEMSKTQPRLEYQKFHAWTGATTTVRFDWDEFYNTHTAYRAAELDIKGLQNVLQVASDGSSQQKDAQTRLALKQKEQDGNIKTLDAMADALLSHPTTHDMLRQTGLVVYQSTEADGTRTYRFDALDSVVKKLQDEARAIETALQVTINAIQVTGAANATAQKLVRKMRDIASKMLGWQVTHRADQLRNLPVALIQLTYLPEPLYMDSILEVAVMANELPQVMADMQTRSPVEYAALQKMTAAHRLFVAPIDVLPASAGIQNNAANSGSLDDWFAKTATTEHVQNARAQFSSAMANVQQALLDPVIDPSEEEFFTSWSPHQSAMHAQFAQALPLFDTYRQAVAQAQRPQVPARLGAEGFSNYKAFAANVEGEDVYTEVVVTLDQVRTQTIQPDVRDVPSTQAAALEKMPTLVSQGGQHFTSLTNIVSWVRMQEVAGLAPNGLAPNNMTFLWELQSDWGQEGARSGLDTMQRTAARQVDWAKEKAQSDKDIAAWKQLAASGQNIDLLDPAVWQLWSEYMKGPMPAQPPAPMAFNPLIATTERYVRVALSKAMVLAAKQGHTHVVLPQAGDIAPYVASESKVPIARVAINIDTMWGMGGAKQSSGMNIRIVDAAGLSGETFDIPWMEAAQMRNGNMPPQQMAERIVRWVQLAAKQLLSVDGAAFVDKLGPNSDLVQKLALSLEGQVKSKKPIALQLGDVRSADMNTDGFFIQGNQGLRSFYDTMLPRLAKEWAKKNGMTTEPVSVMISPAWKWRLTPSMQQRMAIKISDELKAKPEMPLFQGARGAYLRKERTIALFEAADLSTFLHEASHWYVSQLFARARRSTATQATRDSAHRVLRSLGVRSFEEWDNLPQEQKEARHEQFAYLFEEYLRNGNAPSIELQSVFGRISRWMRRLYTNIRDTLGPIYERLYGRPLPMLTGEMRDTFDRMLASEEQIQSAQVVRELVPMFQSREEALAAGMTEEQWTALQEATDEAEEAAIGRLSASSRREMELMGRARAQVIAQLEREERDRMRVIRKEVEKEFEKQRTYRVLRWLMTGKSTDESGRETQEENHRLSRASVERIVDSGVEPGLPKTSPDSPQLERTQEALAAVLDESLEAQRAVQVANTNLAELQARMAAELNAITAQQAANTKPEIRLDRRDRMSVRAAARGISIENANVKQVADLLREQVIEEYSTPIAQAQRAARNAQSRVDALAERAERIEIRMERITPSIAEDVLDKLGRRVANDGLDAIVVAERFGYQGGASEMLRELFAAVPYQQAVEREVEKRMRARYGDPMSQEAVEDQVTDALHDEARNRMVRIELQWLEDQITRIGGQLSEQQRAEREAATMALPLAEQNADRLELLLRKLQESRGTQAIEQPIRIEMQAVRERIRAARELNDQQAEGRESARLAELQQQLNAAQGPEILQTAQELRDAEAELRRLRSQSETGRVPAAVIIAAAREAARQRVEQTVVRDLDSSQNQVEEGRAARETLRALRDGDPTAALAAKRRQILQQETVRETRAAQREVSDSVDSIRTAVQRDTESMARTHNMDLVSAARVLAGMFGIGTQRQFERAMEQLRAIERYAPAMWQRLQGIMGPMLTEVQDYREMTMAQFREVVDTIQGLLTLAREDMTAQIAGQQQQIETVQQEMVATLQTHPAKAANIGSTSAVTARQRMMLWVSHMKALLRRVESWCIAIDGGRGVFVRKLFEPLKQALDAYKVRRNDIVGRYVQMMGALQFGPDTIQATEIGYTFGAGHNGVGMAELLGALLHTGNASNYRKLLLGRGWATEDANGVLDDSRWRRFIARMHRTGKLKKEHYDWLQGVWDLAEEIKPDLQSAHRQVFGTFFREVQAQQIVTPFGTYRGGYVPAKTDPVLVREAQLQQRIEELEGDFRQSVPSVQSGWRHSRIENYTRALNLDLRMMARHFDETLRFAYVQPVLRQSVRILRGRDVQQALGNVDPKAYEDMLLPWLMRAARQQTSQPGMSKSIDRFWSQLRARVGADRMFLNISNALQNFTGLFTAWSQVDARFLLSGVRAYLAGPPWKYGQEIAQQSAFMNNLLNNQMAAIADRMDELVMNPDSFGRLQNVATRNAYIAQTMTQNVVTLITWKGAYDQAIARQSTTMTPQEAHAEAVAAADQVVRQTQSSLEPEDVARYEASTPFVRVFLQFSGFFNTMANTNATQFGNLWRAMGFGSLVSSRLWAQAVLGYALPLLVSDAIGALLAGRLPEDEDEDGYLDEITAFTTASLFRGTAAMVPAAGQLANAVVNAMDDQPYNDRLSVAPAVQALEAATIGVVRAGKALFDPDKEISGRNLKDVLSLIAVATGVPLAPAGRIGGFMLDEAAGRVEAEGPFEYAAGLISGTAARPSR
jgi:hypothetical protein